MSWTEQSQAGTRVWGDRTKINLGKKQLSQQNHPLLIALPLAVDLALPVDVPLAYVSLEQWKHAFVYSKGKAEQAPVLLQP